MIKEILYKWLGLEELPCHSCETLRMQLEIANHEKKELLQTILEMNKPKIEIREEVKNPVPIQPKNVPWSIRQQMIEAEDRRAAQIIAERNRMREIERREIAEKVVDEEVAKLEKELGVENAG